MRTKIVIGLSAVAAVLALTCVACAPMATTASKVQLSSGATVWDVSGDWDAFVENYGPNKWAGTYSNVYRITQTGSAFQASRLRDTPPPMAGKAGSLSLQGELEGIGFKRVAIVVGSGDVLLSKRQISEDGRKIVIDDGFMITVTLTRP